MGTDADDIFVLPPQKRPVLFVFRKIGPQNQNTRDDTACNEGRNSRLNPARPSKVSDNGCSRLTEITTPPSRALARIEYAKSCDGYLRNASMLWADLSTLRSRNCGMGSHCSGVGLSLTSPFVAVLTSWWMISIPLIFESLKRSLYQLLKTKMFRPRVSKYSRSFSLSVLRSSRGNSNKNAVRVSNNGRLFIAIDRFFLTDPIQSSAGHSLSYRRTTTYFINTIPLTSWNVPACPPSVWRACRR